MRSNQMNKPLPLLNQVELVQRLRETRARMYEHEVGGRWSEAKILFDQVLTIGRELNTRFEGWNAP